MRSDILDGNCWLSVCEDFNNVRGCSEIRRCEVKA